MKERIVNLETLDFETSQEVSLRPNLWEDFIGQEKLKVTCKFLFAQLKNAKKVWITCSFLARPVWVKLQ